MIQLREMTAEDWSAVEQIYAQGIGTGVATFQTETPEWSAWNSGHHACCRLVACDAESGRVAGFAVLSPVSARPVYAGVAEVSVYVAPDVRGQGVGGQLLRALIEASEQSGFWTLQSAIIALNEASVALHRACGFRTVGRRERIARGHSGEWLDVILMEKRRAT